MNFRHMCFEKCLNAISKWKNAKSEATQELKSKTNDDRIKIITTTTTISTPTAGCLCFFPPMGFQCRYCWWMLLMISILLLLVAKLSFKFESNDLLVNSYFLFHINLLLFTSTGGMRRNLDDYSFKNFVNFVLSLERPLMIFVRFWDCLGTEMTPKTPKTPKTPTNQPTMFFPKQRLCLRRGACVLFKELALTISIVGSRRLAWNGLDLFLFA